MDIATHVSLILLLKLRQLSWLFFFFKNTDVMVKLLDLWGSKFPWRQICHWGLICTINRESILPGKRGEGPEKIDPELCLYSQQFIWLTTNRAHKQSSYVIRMNTFSSCNLLLNQQHIILPHSLHPQHSTTADTTQSSCLTNHSTDQQEADSTWTWAWGEPGRGSWERTGGWTRRWRHWWSPWPRTAWARSYPLGLMREGTTPIREKLRS